MTIIMRILVWYGYVNTWTAFGFPLNFAPSDEHNVTNFVKVPFGVFQESSEEKDLKWARPIKGDGQLCLDPGTNFLKHLEPDILGRDYSIFNNPHKSMSDYEGYNLLRRAVDSEYVFTSERGLGMRNFLRPSINSVSSLIDLAVTDPGCYYAETQAYEICHGEDISEVPTETIASNLKHLKIIQTNISVLRDEAFQNKEIEVLSLTANRISSIEADAFKGLTKTRYLEFSNNGLTYNSSSSQHSFFGLFKYLENLEQIDFSDNRLNLTGVDAVMYDVDPILPCLRQIIFDNNPIESIEKNLFYGLRESNLQEISLVNCNLKEIHANAFEYLILIRHIDLYNNRELLEPSLYRTPVSFALGSIPSTQFTSLGMGNNNLYLMPIGVNMAVGGTVERLNLAGNIFTILGDSYNHFPGMGPSLKFLILRRCLITVIYEKFFEQLDVLEYLNLAENQLRTVPPAIRRPFINTLDLSFQCWPIFVCSTPFWLEVSSFEGMDSLRILDLRGNLRTVEADVFSGAKYLEDLDISSIFLNRIHKHAFRQNSRLRKLRCHQCWQLEPIDHELWPYVYNIEELDLSYSPHSITPGPDNGRSAIILLPNLKSLNLTCSLVLNHTMCDEGLYQYESPLDPELLKALVKLENLDLSKNGLTSWTNRRFYNSSRLSHLSISNNKFRALTRAMLEDFEQLEYLDLRMSGPYVECSIEVVEFYNWAEEKIASGKLELVGWNRGNDYHCEDLKRSEIRSFLDYHKNHDLIPAQGDPVDRQKIFSQGLILGLIAMGTVLLLFIVASYRKRFFISFWLMKQRRKWRDVEKKDMSNLYDVFISYSHEDQEWVTKQLIPQLEENSPKLKVCIHERDFKIGITVTENIVECIYRSEKFLIILSDSYVKSQWCNFETHVAQHTLTDMGRDSILLVIKDKISLKLNTNLSYLLRSRTYLQWPGGGKRQEHFWLKLKQSLHTYKSFADLRPIKRVRLNSM